MKLANLIWHSLTQRPDGSKMLTERLRNSMVTDGKHANGRSPEKEPERPEKKRGILRRILDLSAAQRDAEWHASVNPASINVYEYRPDIADFRTLTGEVHYH